MSIDNQLSDEAKELVIQAARLNLGVLTAFNKRIAALEKGLFITKISVMLLAASTIINSLKDAGVI